MKKRTKIKHIKKNKIKIKKTKKAKVESYRIESSGIGCNYDAIGEERRKRKKIIKKKKGIRDKKRMDIRW